MILILSVAVVVNYILLFMLRYYIASKFKKTAELVEKMGFQLAELKRGVGELIEIEGAKK